MGKIRKRHRSTHRRGRHPAPQRTATHEPRFEMEKPIPLHLADNFQELTELVNDDFIKGLKKIDRLPAVGQRLVTEMRQFQKDQERVYIIGRRYIKVMDHYFAHIDDKVFLELRYGSEYRHICMLVSEVEEDLKARYNSLATFEEEARIRDIAAAPSAASDELARLYIQPTGKKSEKPTTSKPAKEKPLFKSSEINPVQLFNVLMTKENILIVDIRPSEEYNESQIIIEDGHMLNIPIDIIVPGLSANTLGQRLDKEAQEIWNKRETFRAIVLVDRETDMTNFSGSTLERVKNIIVEWDFNRKYHQHPVVLRGGFKEFMEWYPSEVTNRHAYLSQTNSEMDELLTIDDIDYPELGSAAGNMNLKVHTISSFGDLQARIARDFGDTDVTPGPPARASRSEGQLPKDFYASKGKSPYRSLSEESLPRDYFNVETLDPLPALDIGRDEEADDKLDEIRSTIEGDRAELLKEARALKPKPSSSPRADPRDVIIRNLIEENQDMFLPPTPSTAPAIDRSFKPPQVQGRAGEGYTGIKNVRNNCYVSSMLQCLKVIPIVKSMFVSSNSYVRHIHRHPPVITLNFASVMKILWEGTPKRHRVYHPHTFLEKLYDLNKVYARGNHEDTFEFFIFLFNHLSEDCSFDLARPRVMTEREKSWYSQLQGRSSYFIDLTYYQLKNTKVCWKCQKPNLVFDNDSTIMLHIPDRKEPCTLEYLLKEYMKENLVVDYSCADCKSTATIVNRKEIVVDPEILIIVLKRYVANPDGTFRKNELNVSFPVDNLEFGRSLYKLYSIPQHTGTMSVGHYYASVLLHETEDIWVLFNDDRITRYHTPITEVPGIKSSCVGFFYVRTAEKKSDC